MFELLEKLFSANFLEKWQTLIGSAIGLFFAAIFSIFGFFLKRKIQKVQDRKEATRRAEIAFSQTLNHILTTVSQLKGFIDRVKMIKDTVTEIKDSKTYAMQETNFPPIISIQYDEELSKMKFRTYYLHNKILIIEYITRWANSTIAQFRIDFEKLLKKNESMMTIATPESQRSVYIQNLEGYIEMVEIFLHSLEGNNFKSIVQAKVHNLKLMKHYFPTIWKYEGTSLKYFKNNHKKEAYNGSLEAVDRINLLLENPTNDLIAKIEKRAKQQSL